MLSSVVRYVNISHLGNSTKSKGGCSCGVGVVLVFNCYKSKAEALADLTWVKSTISIWYVYFLG